MNKYSIDVIETSRTGFVVEAETQEEALRLFLIWADHNVDEVADRLDKGFCGWKLTDPLLSDEDPDITHAELLSEELIENDKYGGNI